MEDRLIVGIDMSKGKEHTCLKVCRENSQGLTVIKEAFDEEAKAIYRKLTENEQDDYYKMECKVLRTELAKYEAENDNLKKSLYWLSRNLVN